MQTDALWQMIATFDGPMHTNGRYPYAGLLVDRNTGNSTPAVRYYDTTDPDAESQTLDYPIVWISIGLVARWQTMAREICVHVCADCHGPVDGDGFCTDDDCTGGQWS